MLLTLLLAASSATAPVFDAHLHGARDPAQQLQSLRGSGVRAIAVSTNWDALARYREAEGLDVHVGLMLPCPDGKVPYSLQPCFADGREWPGVDWVRTQVEQGRIHFLGEVLAQYHGIPPSDPRFFPYYELALEFDLPVGIHTGSAGPDHGSPAFREELGNPALLRPVLGRYPGLRVWLMHAGGPYLDEAIALMRDFPGVHADLSAINNPGIVPPPAFKAMVGQLLDAGLEDRLMFGTDNADPAVVLASLDGLGLGEAQERKLLHDNAARFFAPRPR